MSSPRLGRFANRTIDPEAYVSGYEVNQRVSINTWLPLAYENPIMVASRVEGFPLTTHLRGIFPLGPKPGVSWAFLSAT